MGSTRTSETQRVDLNAIRIFIQRVVKAAPITIQNPTEPSQVITYSECSETRAMILELCDLVEGSTLLEDASRARVEAAWLDEPLTVRNTTVRESIGDLDPEHILPSRY